MSRVPIKERALSPSQGGFVVKRIVALAVVGALMWVPVALAAAPAGAKDVSTWTRRFVGGERGASPLVDAGRVWWTAALGGSRAAGGVPYGLNSRALGGGAIRRLRLELPAAPPPVPIPGYPEGSPATCTRGGVGVDAVAVADGEAFITGGFSTAYYEDVCPRAPFAARYSTIDGASLPVPFPEIRLAPFAFPWITRVPAVFPARSDGGTPVGDWRTGPTVTDVPPGGRSLQTTERFTGWIEGRTPGFGRDAWNDAPGWDLFRVVDTASGETVYTVTAEQLVRRATSGRAVADPPRLLEDGSLAVRVQRKGGAGLGPVHVTATGAVRRVGPRLPRATVADTMVAYGRAFVETNGGRWVGRPGRRVQTCGGLWITSTTGRRGRLLGRFRDRPTPRSSLPLFWDGRSALWFYSSGVNEPRDSIRVDTGLKRLPLSARDLPGCRG